MDSASILSGYLKIKLKGVFTKNRQILLQWLMYELHDVYSYTAICSVYLSLG